MYYLELYISLYICEGGLCVWGVWFCFSLQGSRKAWYVCVLLPRLTSKPPPLQ